MDYEKAYKEALEKAEETIKYYKERKRNEASIEDLQGIFPELKESEDERIKKELIAYHRSMAAAMNGNRPCVHEAWIAWLEKQGVYREILSFINSLDVLTLDNIKEMENQAFMHGIEVERNKNIFKDNKEIKI